MDNCFKAMVKLVVPPAKQKHFTFHSYRIYLACALDAAGCPPQKIKRILRWISDEALQTYVRDGEQVFEHWLDAAARSEFDAMQVANMDSPHAAVVDYIEYDSDATLDDAEDD